MLIRRRVSTIWLCLSLVGSYCCVAGASDQSAGAAALGRLRMDEHRCRKLAEVTLPINMPVGVKKKEVEVYLSEDQNIYSQCMERAGEAESVRLQQETGQEK